MPSSMIFPMSARRRAVGPDTDHRGAHAAFPGEVLPRLLRQRHENPAFLEDSERSPLRISAHRVEHNVHVANVIFKARRLVVDRFVAAEFSDQIDVFGAGSGADHSCAVRLCKLHRHRPDSASRRVDKHRLPSAQFRGVKQCLVRRQRADRYGRRAGEIECPGLDCQSSSHRQRQTPHPRRRPTDRSCRRLHRRA